MSLQVLLLYSWTVLSRVSAVAIWCVLLVGECPVDGVAQDTLTPRLFAGIMSTHRAAIDMYTSYLRKMDDLFALENFYRYLGVCSIIPMKF